MKHGSPSGTGNTPNSLAERAMYVLPSSRFVSATCVCYDRRIQVSSNNGNLIAIDRTVGMVIGFLPSYMQQEKVAEYGKTTTV